MSQSANRQSRRESRGAHSVQELSTTNTLPQASQFEQSGNLATLVAQVMSIWFFRGKSTNDSSLGKPGNVNKSRTSTRGSGVRKESLTILGAVLMFITILLASGLMRIDFSGAIGASPSTPQHRAPK